MFSSVPVLDVFFIDFAAPEETTKSKASGLLKAATFLIAGPVAFLATTAGLKALGEDGPSLKRIIEDKHFNIIKSEEELKLYKNASENNWVINEKSLKKRQYYIRHPKKNNENILVEAKAFYDYIEEEQKDELIEFIMAHCPVKSISIDRNEIVGANGNANANIKGLELSGGANCSQSKGNYYSYSNPNGAPKIEPRESYLWLDKSIMRSISALTKGATLSQTYQYDCTFGLNISEAKTIGLDLNRHKKYSYTIQIEC